MKFPRTILDGRENNLLQISLVKFCSWTKWIFKITNTIRTSRELLFESLFTDELEEYTNFHLISTKGEIMKWP